MDVDIISRERCYFCKGTLISIKTLDRSYLVQCEDCGAITESSDVIKYKCKPSRVKKLRKAKRRFSK